MEFSVSGFNFQEILSWARVLRPRPRRAADQSSRSWHSVVQVEADMSGDDGRTAWQIWGYVAMEPNDIHGSTSTTSVVIGMSQGPASRRKREPKEGRENPEREIALEVLLHGIFLMFLSREPPLGKKTRWLGGTGLTGTRWSELPIAPSREPSRPSLPHRAAS